MTNETVALIGFVSLFTLMLLRVPVGMAMGLVGITGFGYLTGFAPALKLVGQTTMRTVTDYSFGVIPMFLLMGAFVTNSGMSRELFRAANAFVGHRKGGLGIATIAACGGFGDGGMGEEHGLHLAGHDGVAAAQDQVLLAVHHVELAVDVRVPDVAGVQPAACQRRGVLAVPVAGHHVGSPDADLAGDGRLGDRHARHQVLEHHLA